MVISEVKHMNPQVKKLLWIAFLVLTSVILAYPANLRLESFPIFSPDIFENQLYFGVLFYLWAILLIVLFFTPGEGKGKWERLALVVITTLVFRGYWNIIAPMQLEATYHTTTARIWESANHIISGPGVGYADWPATSLLGVVLLKITGLGSFSAITILCIFIVITLAMGIYVFLLKVFNSSFSASLGSLLIIIGNLAMIIFYKPGPIAIIFVVLFLTILFWDNKRNSASLVLVSFLLLAGAVVTHFHTSMHFFFISLGLWIFAVLRRQPGESRPGINLLLVSLIVPIIWLAYWGTAGFREVSLWSRDNLLNSLFSLERWTGVFTIGQANLGESAPLWYSLIRWLWLGLLYAAGGLLWLRSLIRFRRLGITESRLAAALFGLALLSLISCMISPRGFAELLRALTYIPFFTLPLLILFLLRFKPAVTKVILVGLSLLIVLLSFPSFLANNSRINSDATHVIEFSTGEWLHSLYGTGERLSIFATASTYQPVQFYLSDATYFAERQTHEFEDWTEESLWQAMEELQDKFMQSALSERVTIYIDSPKEALQRSMSFNVPYDHPRWRILSAELSANYDMVYNNGPIQIYKSGR
jgi:hypothetical protein